MGHFSLIIGLIVLASTASGCRNFFSRGGLGQAVTVAQVETRKTAPTMTVTATLNASDTATINFPQDVRVEKFAADVGDEVLKGDPLLHLDESELRTQLHQERTARREVQARTEKNQYLLEHRSELREAGKMSDIQSTGIEKEVALDEAELARVDADIAAIEHALSQTTVPSPLNGMVIKRHVAPNETVGAEKPILELVNVDPILATFHLDADEAGGIAIGDTVKVRIDELGGETFDASVRFVGPELHLPDRTFAVWAIIPNPERTLKLGMRGFAEFNSTKEHDVYVIPASAIVMQRNQPHLFVIEEGIARLRRVVVKSITKQEAVLTGGVTANAWVAVKGQEDLADGAIVDMRR
ncbi:MAG: efflux RND transporter periplasmic adaptor subunit [Deltaproteobacteria bacterium]|nr:efflux RND transporter periplasmic adaptor subunit [Deltaproteobacteria bacterium]